MKISKVGSTWFGFYPKATKVVLTAAAVATMLGCSKPAPQPAPTYDVPQQLQRWEVARGQVEVEGRRFVMVEAWADDRITLWESEPRSETQFFIANTLGVEQGGTPVFVPRVREAVVIQYEDPRAK